MKMVDDSYDEKFAVVCRCFVSSRPYIHRLFLGLKFLGVLYHSANYAGPIMTLDVVKALSKKEREVEKLFLSNNMFNNISHSWLYGPLLFIF